MPGTMLGAYSLYRSEPIILVAITNNTPKIMYILPLPQSGVVGEHSLL